MTAIRVSVTAEHMQPVDSKVAWADPVIAALERLTGEDVSIDGDGDQGNIATIGQGAWTIVVDLPADVNDWLNRRWDGDADDRGASEPFDFDLEIPEWVVALVNDPYPLLTLREAAALLGVSAATLRQLIDRETGSPTAERLRPVKRGRDWFVSRRAVEAEVDRRIGELGDRLDAALEAGEV